MESVLQQRFFRLLSEYSQYEDSSMNEQDYNVLLRYFSFGLHRLKSYRVRFEQEKNALSASN